MEQDRKALDAVKIAPPLQFTYRNYKGEVRDRTVTPLGVRFGATEWHPEPQWLLRAFDHDKQAEREFAMAGIVGGTTPSAPPAEADYAQKLVEQIHALLGFTNPAPPIPHTARLLLGRAADALDALTAPAEKAEAEVALLREALAEIRDAYTAHSYSDAMDAVQALKDAAREALK